MTRFVAIVPSFSSSLLNSIGTVLNDTISLNIYQNYKHFTLWMRRHRENSTKQKIMKSSKRQTLTHFISHALLLWLGATHKRCKLLIKAMQVHKYRIKYTYKCVCVYHNYRLTSRQHIGQCQWPSPKKYFAHRFLGLNRTYQFKFNYIVSSLDLDTNWKR